MIGTDNTVRDSLDHTLFSWTKQAGLDPINVVRAEGCYVYDDKGRRFLDFSSQLMNVNIGHCHPRVLESVKAQMEKVSYVFPGMVTEVRGRVGKKLAQLAPGDLNKTFFTLGGAESIENAIKLARVYTGKHKILAQYRSYHGSTMGAMSVSGDPRRHSVDAQQMPNVVHVENPYFYRCPWNSPSPEECGRMALAHIERVIEFENPDTIAAFVLEGESGSSGCIKYPKGYWKGVREICDKNGILLIDDEVMSGFGRTGKMFAVENHEVVPDMICMAKGLTAGYLPLGGVIVSDRISKKFDEVALPIGLTYSAHPVCLAAADAVLDIYEEEGLLENAVSMGRYIEGEVEKLKDKHPSIGDFRNTGLLGCIELVRNRQTKEPMTPWNARPADMAPTNRLFSRLRQLGMFTLMRWSYLFIAPPLTISREEVDEGLGIISEALEMADEYCKD